MLKAAQSPPGAGRLTVVLSTAVYGVIIINDSGSIDVYNPAYERLFGYKAKDVLGKNVYVPMPGPYHEEHDGNLRNSLNTGERYLSGLFVTSRSACPQSMPCEKAKNRYAPLLIRPSKVSSLLNLPTTGSAPD